MDAKTFCPLSSAKSCHTKLLTESDFVLFLTLGYRTEQTLQAVIFYWSSLTHMHTHTYVIHENTRVYVQIKRWVCPSRHSGNEPSLRCTHLKSYLSRSNPSSFIIEIPIWPFTNHDAHNLKFVNKDSPDLPLSHQNALVQPHTHIYQCCTVLL